MARYDIPDHLLDQLYVPVNPSPNSDLFTRNKEQRLPIPVLGLDNMTSWASDLFQDLSTRINNVVVGGIGVAGNQNQLVAFGQNNTLVALDLQTLLDTLGALNFDGSNINAGTIYGQSIRAQTLTTNLYQAGSVTNPVLAPGAVTNVNIANGAVTLPKMRSTGHSCFIIGDDADYTYKELPVAANYYVPTRIANATLPSMQPISAVWNNSANNLCSGIKIQDNTTPLSKMVASGNKCLVMGSTGSNVYTEKVADNQSQPWYVFCNNPNAASISLNSLVDIWQNTPFTFTGSKLTNNSVPVTKIQNSSQVAPFCMAFINANGSAQKSMNLGSINRTGLGYYTVRFNTAANDAKYIVVFGSEDNGGNYVTNAYVAQGSRTINGFDVQVWGQGRGAQDEGFNFVVYAF